MDALRRLAVAIREAFRTEDVVARWGGEEFVLGMYGSTAVSGAHRLRSVLKQFQDQAFSSPDGQSSTSRLALASPNWRATAPPSTRCVPPPTEPCTPRSRPGAQRSRWQARASGHMRSRWSRRADDAPPRCAPPTLTPEALAGQPRALGRATSNSPTSLTDATRRRPADVAKPQSVPAITFSRPTSRAYCSIRCATSSGCSTKFVAESMTPGISTLPSGSFTSSHTCHSWAWRGFDASTE